MKKIFILLAAALISLTGLSQSFEYKGLQYNVTSENDLRCEVAQNFNISGNLVIPKTVEYEHKTYSVTSIGASAFSNCSSLTSVEIPNSVTSIGDRAFSGCFGLTSVEIPNSVTSIGASAFSNCFGLTSIEIPNSVTSIGYEVFSSCRSLTSVEIPNSVTSIGYWAFSGCSGLTSIEIPNSVTSIGASAFADCSGLKSINVDNGNSSFTSVDGILYNKSLDTILCYPGGLQGGFTIPNSVTSIGDWAFYDCFGLKRINIGKNVKEIGKYAFENCDKLEEVLCNSEVPPPQ